MKGRMKRETGGRNQAAEDLDKKNMEYTKDSKVNSEAVERKRGGRAKKVVDMEGEEASKHAGRKARKSGGKATSDANPFTSAKAGTPAPGRKVMSGMES